MCNCKKKANVSSAPPAPKVNSPSIPMNRFTSIQPKAKPAAREVEIDDIPGDTLKEKCAAFACLLGLAEPVSEKVMVGAVDDPSYARSLLENRNSPGVLKQLLENPPSRMFERIQKNNSGFSNSVLIAKAGKALLKWGASGFQTVSAFQLEVRENACLACPNLKEPETVLQKITASSRTGSAIGYRTGNKVCGLCGCVVKNKMRLTTDTCPQEDPNVSGFNRWGEPHVG